MYLKNKTFKCISFYKLFCCLYLNRCHFRIILSSLSPDIIYHTARVVVLLVAHLTDSLWFLFSIMTI